jgi:hypothetical protein
MARLRPFPDLHCALQQKVIFKDATCTLIAISTLLQNNIFNFRYGFITFDTQEDAEKIIKKEVCSRFLAELSRDAGCCQRGTAIFFTV